MSHESRLGSVCPVPLRRIRAWLKTASRGLRACNHAHVVKTSPYRRTVRSARPVRVALVDRHDLSRRGLRLLLDQEPDIEIVGDVADGRTAVGIVAKHRPDVVVLDPCVPPWDLAETRRRIKSLRPATRIVLMSDQGEYASARLAGWGVDAHVAKDGSVQAVAWAIRLAAQRVAA